MSNFYLTLHRDYEPTLGRWLSADSSVDEPVGPGGIKVVNLADPQTWNLYAYVTDNPTTLNDPTGLGAHCTGQNTEHNNVLTCEQAQAAAQLTATLKNSTQERAQKQNNTESSHKTAERLVMAGEAALNVEIAKVKIGIAQKLGEAAAAEPETAPVTLVGAAALGISASGNLAAAGAQVAGAATGHIKGANAAAQVGTVATSAAGLVALVTTNGNVQKAARWAALEGVVTANPDELLHGTLVEVTAKVIDYLGNVNHALGF